MASIEQSLARMAELLAQTTEHTLKQAPTVVSTPNPTHNLAAIREVRHRERDHYNDLALLSERPFRSGDDLTADKIADTVRDMELHLLLEKISKLEARQTEHPSEDITEELRSIRKAIVDLLLLNPPIEDNNEHILLEQQLRAILDRVFATEKDQVMNPTKGAAPEVATTKQKLQNALKS